MDSPLGTSLGHENAYGSGFRPRITAVKIARIVEEAKNAQCLKQTHTAANA